MTTRLRTRRGAQAGAHRQHRPGEVDFKGTQLFFWTHNNRGLRVYTEYNTHDLAAKVTTGFESPDASSVLTQYDEWNRRSEVDANGEVTEYQYDNVSNLRFLIDPAGNMTEFVVDELNRRTMESTASGDRTFEYDMAGNLRRKTDCEQRVTRYDYDDLHRRTSETWRRF